MHKTILFLLATAMAMPGTAIAADPDEREDRAERRAERQAERAAARAAERSEPSEVRIERSNGGEQHMRVDRDPGERRAIQLERRDRVIEEVREVRREPSEIEAEKPRRAIAIGDTIRTSRVRDGDGNPLVQDRADSTTPEQLRERRLRRLERVARGGDVDGREPPAISRIPREGTQPPPARVVRRGDRDRDGARRWDGNWRHDGRYDWRRWRDRNRSRFHLGLYFDPFGWNYRRYHIGWRMWPHYYRSSYWLNDPWMYRLPYAPPGYRWIRYYDDAILIDTWDGQVVDVIHNFFW